MLTVFELRPDNTWGYRLNGADMKKIISAIWDHDLMAVLSQIRTPVVIMPTRDNRDSARGQADSQKKERVARARGLLGNCKVVWLENISHSATLEHPQNIAAALRSHVDSAFFEPDTEVGISKR